MKATRPHPRLIDMVGWRFGSLEVVRLGPKKSGNSAAFWLCRCDCGNASVVLASSLRRGKTGSCGCKAGAQKQETSETLTHDRLLALLSYEPLTGLFRWKISPSVGVRVGDVAGKAGRAYILIQIWGKKYRAHRLAWFYVTGRWPTKIIDHEDNDGLNNRWLNLREATRSQNGANSRGRRPGLKGAYWHKKSNRWFSVIAANGARSFLGYFANEREAHEAYVRAAKEVHGQFARAA